MTSSHLSTLFYVQWYERKLTINSDHETFHFIFIRSARSFARLSIFTFFYMHIIIVALVGHASSVFCISFTENWLEHWNSEHTVKYQNIFNGLRKNET